MAQMMRMQPLQNVISRIDELLKFTFFNEKSLIIPKTWKENEDIDIPVQVLTATAGSISNLSIRFALLMKMSPSVEAVDSICNELSEFCDKMVSALGVIILGGAGKPLKEILSSSVRGVLNSLKELIESPPDNLAPRTGIVEENCRILSLVPKNNQNAYIRDILLIMSEMRDSIREFSEMIEVSRNEMKNESEFSKNDDELDNDDDGDELDYFGMNDKYGSEIEIRCATDCINLLKLTRQILFELKEVELIMNGNEEERQWVAEIQLICSEIQTASIDFATNLYPTIEPEDVKSSSRVLCDCLHKLIQQTLSASLPIIEELKAKYSNIEPQIIKIQQEIHLHSEQIETS